MVKAEVAIFCGSLDLEIGAYLEPEFEIFEKQLLKLGVRVGKKRTHLELEGNVVRGIWIRGFGSIVIFMGQIERLQSLRAIWACVIKENMSHEYWHNKCWGLGLHVMKPKHPIIGLLIINRGS